MTATDFDHAIDDLARRQHGAFSHRQATAAGGTARMIDRRRHGGRWVQLDHHVYALPSHPGTWLRQAKAAELRFPGGVVSGRSAGVLHELGELRAGAIEITVPRSTGGRTRLARVRYRDHAEVTEVSGIRVLTVVDTIADLAGGRDPALLERVVEDALLRRSISIEQLEERQRTMSARRTRGASLLRSLLTHLTEGCRPPTNLLEAALYRLLDSEGMPSYVRQSPFPWWPEAPERVDAYVPSWRRIVEADGRAWHARQQDFERDRRRDHLAQVHGIEVTRFTYDHLVRRPEYARGVLASLAAQAARLSPGPPARLEVA